MMIIYISHSLTWRVVLDIYQHWRSGIKFMGFFSILIQKKWLCTLQHKLTQETGTYSLPFKLGSIDQLQECSFAVGLTAVRIISRPFSGKHCGFGSVLLCHRLPEGAQPCPESTPQLLSPRRWPYSLHVFPHLFQQVKSSGQELPANVYYGTWPNFLEDHSFSRINCY